MSKVVGVGQLAAAVGEILDAYGDQALRAIEEAAPKVGREARKELEAASPRGNTGKPYAQGWTVKTEHGRLGIRVIVHNKSKPGLTHLLEFGHALRNGGRSRAFPHIAPVNQAAQEKFVELVEKGLRG